MPKHHSEDYKLSAVKYYLKIDNQIKTCEIFKCSERSLMRWVDKYKKSGKIKRKERKYIAYKVTKENVKYIKKLIKKNKTITIQDLTNKLNKKFDINLSRSHIRQVVKDNNITLKQTRLRHEPETRYRKPVYINKQLKIFYKKIKEHKLKDIICIDETSLNAYEVRKHCYGKLGKRCVIKTKSQDVFKKYTGIFAITNRKCIGYIIYEKGGIDSNRLIDFLNEFITTKYKDKLIILDNASSHRNQRVKDNIQENNELLYSVPYQHYTNAIEQYFSVFKSKLRKKKGLGYEELNKNVKRVLREIPRETYKKLFEGSYKREVKYVPKKSTYLKKLKIYK